MEANPGLDVIVCGEWSESPADLLSLPRMRQLVSEASGEYDYVVMDSPALLAHPADVRALAALADSVLLVVRQGTTPREAVSVALSQLTRVRGVILNQSDASDMAAHYRDVTTVSRV
jgi:Mrp family chromosome partitioning ATPase